MPAPAIALWHCPPAIKARRFAPRQQVHGQVVAQRGRRCRGIVFVQRAELNKSIVGLLVDHRALFNPAHFVLIGLDSQKALAMLQHLKGLPVDHLAHAI